jgi:hypothetical protein
MATSVGNLMDVNVALVYLKIDVTGTENDVWYKQHQVSRFSQVWVKFYFG